MASLDNQRQIVDSPIDSTIPRLITSRFRSGPDHFERGTPVVLGSSQASAFTCATTLGGKAGRSPAPITVGETFDAAVKKSLPPATHNLTGRSTPLSNLFIAQSV